jgi:hypothetical protein
VGLEGARELGGGGRDASARRACDAGRGHELVQQREQAGEERLVLVVLALHRDERRVELGRAPLQPRRIDFSSSADWWGRPCRK